MEIAPRIIELLRSEVVQELLSAMEQAMETGEVPQPAAVRGGDTDGE